MLKKERKINLIFSSPVLSHQKTFLFKIYTMSLQKESLVIWWVLLLLHTQTSVFSYHIIIICIFACMRCTTVNVYKNASIESLVSLIYIWVGVQWTLAVCNYINSLVEKTLQILTSLSPWLLRNYISTLMYRLFWLAVEVHKTSFIWRVNL